MVILSEGIPQRPADPLVFIGGAQRSGTTLLRNMLTAHSAIAIPEESWFIHGIYQHLSRHDRAADVHLAWRMTRERPGFIQWQLPPHTVDELLESVPPRSYADLVRSLFAAYARSRGKPHAGDKTTSNALRFLWLAEMFPSSRFVHVLRDPREACMSLAVQPFNQGGLAGAARSWRRHVSRGRAAAERLGPRLLEVRYASLVRDPQTELERLCRFLGLDFDPAMLLYGSSADVLPSHKSHNLDTRAREPLQENVRAWQQELTSDEIALIEFIAGDLMDQVGYPRQHPRLTARAAMEIARESAERAHEYWLARGAPVLSRLWGRPAAT